MLDIKFIDLFSGCGGFSLGFRKEKFEEVYALDFLKEAVETFEYNFGEGTIENIDIYKKDLTTLEKVDILVGSPPCQGFSPEGKRRTKSNPEGKRHGNDRRNMIYKKFIEALVNIQPKIFIMENVPGMKNLQKGKIFEEILKDLVKTGYKVRYQILNAVNYGVPQKRRRIFIMGSKDYDISFPAPTHKESKTEKYSLLDPVTLGEAILDLPELKSGEIKRIYDKEPHSEYSKRLKGNCNELFNHKCQKHNDRMTEKMNLIPIGGNMKDIANKFRENKIHYEGGYRRADPDLPSYTVYWTRAMTSIHPYQPRLFSARECARLQSFPDDFKFLNENTVIKQYTQISNAVPPFVSQNIAKHIKKILNEEEIKKYVSGIDARTEINYSLERFL